MDRRRTLPSLTRRGFLTGSGLGLGATALSTLLPATAGASKSRAQGALPGLPHFPPKAKRVIYLFMSGAPSQLDTLDYKPGLRDRFGTELPASVRGGQRVSTMTSGQEGFPVAPSVFEFSRYGRSGTWVSELMPHLGSVIDEVALIKTMQTNAINHDPAMTFMQTGFEIPGRPSMGSWVSYGLGTENENLPAFVVLTASWTGRKDAQALFSRLWGTGALPSQHQGVKFRSQGDPVLYLSNPEGINRDARRSVLDAVGAANRAHHAQVGDPEIDARIAQYEMAFRMQASVPELTDVMGEPDHVRKLYGPDVDKPGTFAASCLLARRMVERGVRFVQIYHRGWDHHEALVSDLPKQCKDIDQPCAGLLRDLAQRGLLEDTLVVWGGEFGRTVYCQGKLSKKQYGRDHHPLCFPMWVAGGGVQGGRVIGKTDDFSYNVVENPVQVRDLNATILHQLGIDHERLSIQQQGLDVRLTGVDPARVIREIL